MARASMSKDVSKGGNRFQEGRIRILDSYSTAYQYPPNGQTGEQSDAFCALVWSGVRLNDEGKEIEHDGVQDTVEIVHRMGTLDQVRPGLLAAKDFDNTDVEPEDLGSEVDTRGNSFVLDPGAKFGRGWAMIAETMVKNGFKEEVLGRSVTSDLIGLDAHFKTEEGAKYIAKRGKNKGQEVTPENLVCDRIYPPLPYESGAKKAGAKGAGAAVAKGAGAVAGKSTTTAAADTGADDKLTAAMDAAKSLFSDLSDKFKSEVPAGKEVKIDVFRKSMVNELMRRKVAIPMQKQIMDLIIKDDEQLSALAGELVDEPGAFSTDGKVVEFQ